MKTLKSTALRYENNELWILDQRELPHAEKWILCDSVEKMVELIQSLAIRGAPLIGISAALLLAVLLEKNIDQKKLIEAANTLRAARPTAVNLMYCMDKMIEVISHSPFDKFAVIKKAEDLFEEDIILCKKMAEHGAALINSGDTLLTHCNTGALATAGNGTAFGVILLAHQQGKNIHVYVDETRPLLQGARLTTWELKKNGVPYTLNCDNMAASLMQQGKINKVLVGSDRIAANGDFANKIGTYSLAVLCKHHHIPFYVVAPQTTVDLKCPNGKAIPIEQRASHEVKGYANTQWAHEDTPVYNPSFDVTPAELVTAWILDSGVYTDFLQYTKQKESTS